MEQGWASPSHDSDSSRLESFTRKKFSFAVIKKSQFTVAAKIIRTILFLMKDSQNTNLLRFSGYQKNYRVV